MRDEASVARLIGEDRPFQEAYWSFQRVAWFSFAALVAFALAGGMGGEGPLARQSLTSGSAVIDAPRVMRWEANDEIRIREATSPRESIAVVLSPALTDTLQIETISPTPFQTATTRAGTSYWFFLEPRTRADITFHIRAIRPRVHLDGMIQVGDGRPTLLSLTVLP